MVYFPSINASIIFLDQFAIYIHLWSYIIYLIIELGNRRLNILTLILYSKTWEDLTLAVNS